MTVMEFLLVAHSILTGLGVAEVLRGFGDVIQAESVRVSRRLLGIAAWALLLYFEIWWAIWNIGHRDAWSFPDFLLMLLPVVILYLVARLSFPRTVEGADLDRYYERVSPVLWLLVAGVYLSFAVFQPVLYGSFVPILLTSQVIIMLMALIATKVRAVAYHYVLLILMLVQVSWRGIVLTIGT